MQVFDAIEETIVEVDAELVEQREPLTVGQMLEADAPTLRFRAACLRAEASKSKWTREYREKLYNEAHALMTATTVKEV